MEEIIKVEAGAEVLLLHRTIFRISSILVAGGGGGGSYHAITGNGNDSTQELAVMVHIQIATTTGGRFFRKRCWRRCWFSIKIFPWEWGNDCIFLLNGAIGGITNRWKKIMMVALEVEVVEK